MSKKLEKAIKILERRVSILTTRLLAINERSSCYHEIREEKVAMERILEFMKLH